MKEKLQELAKKASIMFIEEGKPLNDAISQLASEEPEINEEMIGRICEMANMITRLHYYRQPDIDQARLAFPIADPSQIVLDQIEDEMVHPDFMSAPVNFAPAEDVEIIPSEPDVKQIEIIIHQKKAHIEDLGAQLGIIYGRYIEARDEFVKEAREHILSGHPATDLNKMAAYVDKQDMLRNMMPHLKTQMQKTAMELEDLINNDLKVTYVLDSHPLVIKYKGAVTAASDVRRKAEELDGEQRELNSLEREIEIPDKKKIEKEAAEFDGNYSIPQVDGTIKSFGPKGAPVGDPTKTGLLERGLGYAKAHPFQTALMGLMAYPVLQETWGAFTRGDQPTPDEIQMAQQTPYLKPSDLKGRDWIMSAGDRAMGKVESERLRLSQMRDRSWNKRYEDA